MAQQLHSCESQLLRPAPCMPLTTCHWSDNKLVCEEARRPRRRFPVPSSPSRNGSSSNQDPLPNQDALPQSPRHQQHPSDPPDPGTPTTNGFAPHEHHHQQAQGPLQQDGDDTRQHEGQVEQHAEASGQCVDALFGVLLQPLLPSTCLWHSGWLLSHLLAHAQSASRQLSPHQQRLLDQVQHSVAKLHTNPACLEHTLNDWFLRTHGVQSPRHTAGYQRLLHLCPKPH